MADRTVIGIDEAGIGPVIGPMIVSGVLVSEDSLTFLKEKGVKDSKMFGSGLKAHNRRKEISEEVCDFIIAEKQVVISSSMLDRHNMYELHISATKDILTSLGWKDTDVVQIEQIGGLKRPGCFSKLGFWHSGFIYEPKADVRYPAVSLASIRAKVARDDIMQELCMDMGEEYISGYPNKNTEIFLRKYFSKYGRLPGCTRFSRNWAPIQELAGDIL